MKEQRKYPGTASREVSEREIRHRVLARRAAAEGMVLLENDSLLPLKEGTKIALYGYGARYTIKGGTGSGSVNNRENVSIDEGLRKNGFIVLTDDWLDDYDARYVQGRAAWEQDILERTGTPITFEKLYYEHSSHPMAAPLGEKITRENKADTEIAMYVISRVSGEGADRKAVKGDYYLSDEEYETLKDISQVYEKVILVLNIGGIIDLSFLDEIPVNAVIYMSQAGMEGGNALADIVSGKRCPGGRLTDTWALSYRDYPSSDTFSHNNGNTFEEKYTEGIYVGYRYFDSFGIPCRYPFGYGLSYTAFDLKWGTLRANQSKICILVEVKNTGTVAGREVLQVYCSCPVERYPKEKRRLVGFIKTDLLKPGESRTYEITFPIELLESWHTGQGSYYMEDGNYYLFGGTNMKALQLVGVLHLNQMKWIQKLDNICPLNDALKELEPDRAMMERWRGEFDKLSQEASVPMLEIGDLVRIRKSPDYDSYPRDKEKAYADTCIPQMATEEKATLCCGRMRKKTADFIGSASAAVSGAAGETTDQLEEKYGIPRMVMADGPAGIRINQKYQIDDNGNIIEQDLVHKLLNRCFGKEFLDENREVYYQFCTAIPIGTLLAQSFDLELLREVGEMIACEMEEFQIRLWLAPGLNIHRNPLCGRNYEYYSEDSLLSGMMAGAITEGVQKHARLGTTIKHFACNNQEENRMGVSATVSERALREIYLKEFEIAVKMAKPKAIMTSYNKINGIHTANSYDLCTKAARKEWGFEGIIMTDWTTTNGHGSSAAKCIEAGNDLIMPGSAGDIQEIVDAVYRRKDQSLKEEYLNASVYRLLKLLKE